MSEDLTRASPARGVCLSCCAVYRGGLERCPRDGGTLVEGGDDPLLGRTLGERYSIERCVGEGAMGRVYLARHTRMGRRFAVKVLFGDLAARADMRARFVREAEAASRLDHPNLVGLVDFGETPLGLLYLAMDFIEGETLEQIIAREAPLPEARVVALVRGLCRGLRHAHERGLVHRDFKPENVLVVRDGAEEVPRVVDFGVALPIEPGRDRLTREDSIVGTPAFMSPEQAMAQKIDHRSDLFSLGVVMYWMLAGRGPFDGPGLEVLRRIIAVPTPPFAERAPEVRVSPNLEALVQRLMAKDAVERPQSASEVLEALEALGQRAAPRGSSRATASQELERLAGVGGKRPSGWILGAAGAVMLVVAAATLLRLGGEPEVGAVELGAPEAVAAPAAVPHEVPPLEAEPPEVEPAEVAPAAPPEPVAAPRNEPRSEPRAAKRVAERSVPPPEAKAPPSERAPDPEPAAPVDTRSLTARYQTVGAALEQLARTHGVEVADPLRRAYFALPLASALRNPALAREVSEKLRALEEEVKRASR